LISKDFTVQVIYADTDMMGRVYYSRYLEYFEAARSHLLRELGLPYSEIENMGIFLPVIESHCDYRSGATFEDILTIRTIVRDLPRSRIRIEYEVIKQGDGTTIVEGYTVHSFINTKGRAVKPPKVFLEILISHWEPSDE